MTTLHIDSGRCSISSTRSTTVHAVPTLLVLILSLTCSVTSSFRVGGSPAIFSMTTSLSQSSGTRRSSLTNPRNAHRRQPQRTGVASRMFSGVSLFGSDNNNATTPPEAKVALLTGCSSGMGLYAAVSFAKKGSKTYATMRDLSKADALKEVAKQKGVEVGILQLDVDDPVSIKKCVQDVVAESGRIDVLVNNAGFAAYGCIETMDIDLVRKLFETNVFGVIQLLQAVLPGMRERKSGLVINVSSISGLVGSPFNDAYVSTKHALEGLIEAMAPVYKQCGVDLVLIEPGATKTDFVSNVQTSGVVVPEEFAAMQANTGKAFGGEFERAQTAEYLGDAIAAIAQMDQPSFRTMPNPDSLAFSACKLSDPDGSKTMNYLTDYFGLAEK